jgi:AcrR family transcriptional regulator
VTVEPGDTSETPSLALRLRVKRSELMLLEIEAVALRMFEARGFGEVTVDDIAAVAQISPRTFYRYFPAKEDVLQVRIAQRSEALRAALAARPADEKPLHALRLALTETLEREDTELLRRWTDVVAASPSVVKSVLGGIALHLQVVIADFFGARLGTASRALVPTMLAAAVGGVAQATQTQWYFEGGDLAAMMSESLEVLERGIGTDPSTWSSATPQGRPRNDNRRGRRTARAKK